MNYVARIKLTKDQRWDRAQARWTELGFHSKVFYKACQMMEESKKDGKKLSGGDAYLLARDFVEAEIQNESRQQSLPV